MTFSLADLRHTSLLNGAVLMELCNKKLVVRNSGPASWLQCLLLQFHASPFRLRRREDLWLQIEPALMAEF